MYLPISLIEVIEIDAKLVEDATFLFFAICERKMRQDIAFARALISEHVAIRWDAD